MKLWKRCRRPRREWRVSVAAIKKAGVMATTRHSKAGYQGIRVPGLCGGEFERLILRRGWVKARLIESR